MTKQDILVLAGGLAGAAGVALSAAAAHMGGGNVATAANFLLLHAPALLALGLVDAGKSRIIGWAGLVMIAGLALFAGDLLMRGYVGTRLFPMAAPAGGVLLIAAWLLAAFGGVLNRSR